MRSMSGRTNKAYKGALASLLQYGIFIILQIFLAPFVLRIAGQEVLGAYSIIMQIVGYGILLDLGFSVALGRYLSRAYGYENRQHEFVEVLTIGQIILFLTNLIFAVIILLVAFWIEDLIVASDFIHSQARIGLYLLAFWTLVKTPLVLYNHGLNATQNVAKANIAGIFGNISRLVLSIALVWGGFGLIGLVAANIVSEFLTFQLQRNYFNKLYPTYLFGWRITNKKLLEKMMSFGFRYWGVNISVAIFLGSDSIIVGNLYGASAASVFYTTKMPAFLLMQFVFKLSDSAAPAVHELFAKKDFQVLRLAYLKIVRYSLLTGVPLALGILGFNREIIALWVGKSQFAGAIMTTALSVFVLSQVLNHINALVVLASGDMRQWSTFSIGISVFSIGLAYWFGGAFGMQWVMVAIAFMDLPYAFFLFIRSLKVLNLPFHRLWLDAIKPSLLACVPLFILVAYLELMDPINSFINLIIFLLIFLGIWAVGLILVGLNSEEKKVLGKRCQQFLF